MSDLKQKLYQCIIENQISFDLINDYASNGYCFWEVGRHNKLLIDKKLTHKLELNKAEEINLHQLDDRPREYLNEIITQLELNMSSNKITNEISKTKVELAREKVIIHSSLFNLKDGNRFVLASLEIHDDFYRSIDKVSDALDLAIWQWNIKTNELIINEKWATIIGYTLKELEPITVQTFIDVTHPADRESTLQLAKDYLSGKIDEYKTEIRFRHKNGTWRWVLAKGKIASRTESGEVEWFIGSHLDITERKTQETEIETLALVATTTIHPVLITDKSGKLIFANASFEKLTGYKSEEILGKKPGDFLQGPETDKKDIQAFRRKLNSGKSFTQDILNYSKLGRPYIISCFVNPVFNKKGEIIKFISIQRDITNEKQNQEYLAKFKNTLDQTNESVFIFDKDNLQINYANQGAIEMMGYAERELLQLHPYDFKPEYSKEQFTELIAPLKTASKSSLRFKTVHRTKSGEDIPVEIFLQYIHNEILSPHFVAIVKDITNEIATEKRLKRLSLVAEKTTNLVVITDDKGRIEYVNSAFEQKSGYLLKEVVGEKPGEFLHGKETNPLHIKANRAGLKDLKPFTQEILNYSRSGEKYWVSNTFNPVFNEKNKLTNFIAIETDITERKHKENLLRESEERLRFVLKASELGYWDWDAVSGKMTVNELWYEMLGYSREDFEPTIENWHALVHPEDMKKLNDIMETVFPDPNKSEFSTEIRAKHKDGHYLWILDRGAIMERNSSGEPSRISGMHMEISKRKKLEIELEKERNFLNDIINANALAIVVINKSGKITFANSRAENILGLKKSKIENTNYDDPKWRHITLNDEPLSTEELPFALVLKTKKPVKDVQHGIVWNDGTVKYISITGSPLNYVEGEIEEVIFSVSDITERVVTQKQLDQTKNRMQSILKDMDDVVWSVTLPEHKMLYITPSVKKLTGFTQSYYLENYVGSKWQESVYEKDKYILNEIENDLQETGSFEYEYRIYTKNNTIKWIYNKGAIIYKDGKPARLDGYMTDISERKTQEYAHKKYLEIVEDQNDRLKNFTYIVSHNLRSHSANIQGLMYLINKKNPKIAENEYVKLLSRASGKLDDTLHHLNNVVSVVSSTDEMQKINLSDAVTAFLDTFENFINKSKIWFFNEVSKDVYVEVVPAFLESIITNLLNNAIKYRDIEKIDSYVRISARNFNGIVIIEIEDNGLGIDLDKYGEKLFGMYKTFHSHKDSRGLGLFLTKNQIESMGGKIEVESKLSIGSTFKVFLKDGNV